MPSCKSNDPEWREFELLVARIEADAGPYGMTVKCPDKIRSRTTGKLREVDASIRYRVGTIEVLITLECRCRARTQDVTWIEQLESKRIAIGADRTIAVSASGFTAGARSAADANGISLRKLSDVGVADINSLLRLDFVQFWHKVCGVTRVGIRKYHSFDWRMPSEGEIDYVLPQDTDPFALIFRSKETGTHWSLNDLWHQLQETTDPFDGVVKGERPVLRTACFPYPGTVTVTTGDVRCLLGDILLTVALSIESEQVSLDAAKKVEYGSDDTTAIQRVEFNSTRPAGGGRRLSLQIPKGSTDMTELRTGGYWPPE